jgi:hypothetical protein
MANEKWQMTNGKSIAFCLLPPASLTYGFGHFSGGRPAQISASV